MHYTIVYFEDQFWSNKIVVKLFSDFYQRSQIGQNLSVNVLTQPIRIKQCQEDYDVINDLIPCHNLNVEHGLGLSNDSYHCIPYSQWCSEGQDFGSKMYSLVCPSFKKLLFDNDEFCQNFTFWKGKPCEADKVRCNGKFIGRCSFKMCDCSDRPLCLSYCSDKSQLICPSVNKKCEQKCFWTCKDNTTCILEELICDGYEHCSDGSDEIQVSTYYIFRLNFTITG